MKRLLQKITGQDAEAAAMRESLEEVIEESERESPALSAQERVMLGNLLKFGELKVRDVMVPRAEIVAVDESIGLADLLKLFREAQHSRLPMFRETLDDPTGLIHVKDVLGLLQPEAGRRLLPVAQCAHHRACAAPSCSRRPRCGRWTCCSRCRPPTPIWRW